jgi:hypothetical protein
VPGLALGKWVIADMNQKIAEPQAAMIAPVSMYDRMIAPDRWPCHYTYLIHL